MGPRRRLSYKSSRNGWTCGVIMVYRATQCGSQRSRCFRGQWEIENSLHWMLDVIFAEDRSRIRTGNGPEIASIFRKLALMVNVPTAVRHPARYVKSVRGRPRPRACHPPQSEAAPGVTNAVG
jgi:hypothetical protein